MDPKISIIVPVYKIEHYIHKCVDSILAQSFKDFELILINDGSPDDSGKICNEYSVKDSRIKVIHKKNGGVSSARNAGIDLATGEYILFVDSDDWIEKDALDTLINQLKLEKSDSIIFGSVKDLYTEQKLIKSELNGVHKKVNINVSDLGSNFVYLFNTVGLLASWMYLFKAKIIKDHKLYFNESLVLYEDFDFNLRFLKNSINLTFIPNVLYHYNMSTSINQLAKRNKYNIVSDINTVSNSLLEFLELIGNKEGIVRQMYPYILTMYTLPLKNIILHKKLKLREKFKVLEELRNDKIFAKVFLEYGKNLKFYKLFYAFINKRMYLAAYYLISLKFK
ncbi:glycosyltransferase family 2 protein [Neobacillus ginsengisoli]|uniref:Glycosyltransferase involved in cell wall biosynthesis n=1 Tax=Neobacillus ginsengisoli TaxID=904295 RepID=A0ABT9XTC5_9BACI|nr:glycosyltransferase family 2 protein [Neobacillus ginsengisoli]MDQ0198774.1 glycosyltransferase involved in cell wall biosynthesis [Neobacillus ginsengisoli]